MCVVCGTWWRNRRDAAAAGVVITLETACRGRFVPCMAACYGCFWLRSEFAKFKVVSSLRSWASGRTENMGNKELYEKQISVFGRLSVFS